MHCSACLTDNPVGLAFCKNCGTPLLMQCPQCGLENPPQEKFCRYCGEEVSGPAKKSYLLSLEGERRFIVALFADIAGFTQLSDQLDPESSTALVNRCLDEMTKTVAESGGRLIRYTGDGLLSVFGAPRSHEDDPERALRSALIMRDAVNKLDFGDFEIKLHIGIACGVVVVGGVGSEGRKEYDVIGHTVNLASHLEEISAPDQILVNEELARLTNHLFSFTVKKIPPLWGVENELNAYELISSLPKTAPLKQFRMKKTPFVGRDSEFSYLIKSVKDLESNNGKVISILGESGIGKSRILYETYTHTRKFYPANTCFFTNASDVTGSSHYGIFSVLVKHAISIQQNLGAHDISIVLRQYLEEIFPNKSDEIYPFFALILSIPLPRQSIKHIDWLKKEELDHRIAISIASWLKELTRKSALVLLFDNMHWVDEDSVSIFKELLPLTKELPLLIVCTARPDFSQAYLNMDGAIYNLPEQSRKKIVLENLALKDTENMVKSILGDMDISKDLVNAIYTRSEGNPLYIEEFLHNLMDRKILTCEASGYWQLTPEWEQVPIPPTIQGIIQSRIDRLERTTRRVLQIASTIGQQIPYDLLSNVTARQGISIDELDEILDELLDTGLIEILSSRGDIYQFKHVCIRDTIYDNMLKNNKADIHLLVANWYEENTLHHKEPPYATIIYHLERAEEIQKKRLYLVNAGYQAMRLYSTKTAREYFDKALEFTESSSLRFDLLLAREKISGLMGDLSQQKKDLDEMIIYSNTTTDEAIKAKVFNRLAIWYESHSNYISAKEIFINGIEAARRVNATSIEAENLHHLASTEWRLGNFPDAILYANEALKLAELINDNQIKAISLTTMGVIHRTLGEVNSAKLHYEKALEIRRKTDDRRGEAINLSQLGNVHYDMANYWQALTLHENALELFKEVGDLRGEAWSLSGIGTALLACGDIDSALRNYQEALRVRILIGDRRGEGVVLADIGNTVLAQGEFDSAINYLSESIHLLKEVGSPRDEMHTLKYLAFALEKAGQYKEATSTYGKVCEINKDLGIQDLDLDCEAGMIRMADADNNINPQNIERLVAIIRTEKLPKCEFPFRVYLTLINHLKSANRISEFNEVLSIAQKNLVDIAENIEDLHLRESFLNSVPENAEISKQMLIYSHAKKTS